MKKAAKTQKSVIAIRKTCKAKGTGLSHYVMAEPKK
jgi:modified peptide precursor CbpA